jgi:chemotaxis protein MotB
MKRTSLATFVAVFMSLLTVVVSAYAFRLRTTLARFVDALEAEKAHTARADADLVECTSVRDAEKSTRERTEQAAAATAAHLTATQSELDELRTQREEMDKRLAAFQAMTEKFRKMIDSGKLQVNIRRGRMIVKLPASVLFPSGSAELSKEGQAALNEVAGILKQFPDRRFMVAGHTDNVPIGTPSAFKNNLELSTARGLTVAQHLIGAGMSASRLFAAGYSEYEPVRPNSSEAGRQENRRIEIELLPNLAELPPLPGELEGASGVTAASTKPAASRRH